jgi:hypothetical protein
MNSKIRSADKGILITTLHNDWKNCRGAKLWQSGDYFDWTKNLQSIDLFFVEIWFYKTLNFQIGIHFKTFNKYIDTRISGF